MSCLSRVIRVRIKYINGSGSLRAGSIQLKFTYNSCFVTIVFCVDRVVNDYYCVRDSVGHRCHGCVGI